MEYLLIVKLGLLGGIPMDAWRKIYKTKEDCEYVKKQVLENTTYKNNVVICDPIRIQKKKEKQ